MSWNYRIMKKTVTSPAGHTEDYYAIYEVHYNREGDVRSWSEESLSPHGISVKELRRDFELMNRAFNKAVLDYDELEKEICLQKGTVRDMSNTQKQESG